MFIHSFIHSYPVFNSSSTGGLVTFRINVAFNKPATMSSRANIQRSSVSPEACSAVNGRTSGIMSTKAGSVNCIITQQDDYEAWWRLDLLHPYTITSLKLYQLDLGTNKDGKTIRTMIINYSMARCSLSVRAHYEPNSKHWFTTSFLQPLP